PRRPLPRPVPSLPLPPLLPGLQPLPPRREVPVRRHQPLTTLVRPLEVVVVDEQPDPLACVLQPLEHRPLHALPPQRAPEPLDLPQRLWVPRPRHQLPDPTPCAQSRELARPPPRVVLRPLVRQYLLWRPVVGDGRLEHLPHQSS